MKKQIEHLLQPRFEVTNTYPNSPYKVGAIIDFKHDTNCILFFKSSDDFGFDKKVEIHSEISDFKKYPHLFREMKWWEGLKEEEMPEYIKIKTKDGFVYKKVICYDISKDYIGFEYENNVFDGFYTFTSDLKHFPISEEEYIKNVKL